VYSVIIYETFNRPPLVQFLERWVLFPLGFARSLGPMQVRSPRLITDSESIAFGIAALSNAFDSSFRAANEKRFPEAQIFDDGARESVVPPYFRRASMEAALREYNIRGDYVGEVLAIHDILVEEFYPQLTTLLLGYG
jgi:hypothetical protein